MPMVELISFPSSQLTTIVFMQRVFLFHSIYILLQFGYLFVFHIKQFLQIGYRFAHFSFSIANGCLCFFKQLHLFFKLGYFEFFLFVGNLYIFQAL